MNKKTSIPISKKRYKKRVLALRAAIEEGIDSGIIGCFDPSEHLKSLKAESERPMSTNENTEH